MKNIISNYNKRDIRIHITNHSGIGNDHLEPSVVEYQVEYLNDLIVRLINKYAK